jgi:hypothetical protein
LRLFGAGGEEQNECEQKKFCTMGVHVKEYFPIEYVTLPKDIGTM